MRDDEFLDILYGWVDLTLNTICGNDISIILGEQDAPRPKPPYMVIHRPVASNKNGRVDQGMPDVTGIREVTFLHSIMVSFECISTTMNYLRLLIDMTDLEEVKNYFTKNKVSFLRSENIMPIPDLQEDSWELRNIVDLHFLVAYSMDENVSYIENIQYENNILE